MPKVSVIMGIYNTNDETIVRASINSILNQTYRDFEFIICDDGSTDNTYELLKKIAKTDNRIIIMKNNKNMGLAQTLNNCLKKSKGEFIARMDSDDISLPTRLEKQLDFLENNPDYSLVGSNVILFDEMGEWGIRTLPEYPNKKNFLFNSPFVHPSVFIRKSSLEVLNGYTVKKETRRCEDYELFMRFYAKGWYGYNIQEPLLKYRENKEAYSRRKFIYRIDETKIRFEGFKTLNLMPVGLIYTIKPLIVGLVPQRILAILRNEKIK